VKSNGLLVPLGWTRYRAYT